MAVPSDFKFSVETEIDVTIDDHNGFDTWIEENSVNLKWEAEMDLRQCGIKMIAPFIPTQAIAITLVLESLEEGGDYREIPLDLELENPQYEYGSEGSSFHLIPSKITFDLKKGKNDIYKAEDVVVVF